MKAQEYKAKAQAKAAQKKAPKSPAVDPIAQENEQLKKQLAEMKAQIAALMAAQVQPTPEETAPEEAPKNPAPTRPEYVKGDWNFKLYVNGEKLEISFEQKQELNEYKRQLAEYIKNDSNAPEVLSGHDWNLVTYNYGRTIYLDGKKTDISKEQHEDIKKYMEMIA